jgi:hypothetical protein
MITLKKAIFALGLGIGMAAGVNAWAAPNCETCESFRLDCAAGDANASYQYNRLRCYYYAPGSCEV